ncbi:MAG: hypothetical protein ACR2GH_15890 [Pseudonocardia sp.]
MRNTLRTLAASALVLSGLTLAPAVASAQPCDSQPGGYCDQFPECGPANEGQIIWGDTYEYQCSYDEDEYGGYYYWGKTGQAYA